MLILLQRYPFVRLLLPLLGGILCGDTFPFLCSVGMGWGMLLLCFIGLLWTYYRHWSKAYGIALLSFLFILGYHFTNVELTRSKFSFSGEALTYQVRLQEAPEVKERSFLCRSLVQGEYQGDTLKCYEQPALFLLYFPKTPEVAQLRRGDELLIHTTLSPPINNKNPDEFDYVRYLTHKGVSGTAYVPEENWQVIGNDSIRSLRQIALDYRAQIVALYRRLGFRGDELAVLSALTVGDKDELSDEIVETYSVSGASHVLALSGLHIGFLYLLLTFLFTPLWKRYYQLKPFLLLVIVLLLWAYAFLTGLSSSVVRSVTMFSLLALATLQPEKPLTLNTLAVTAFLMLLVHPLWLFDVGFQLSFSAVLAIILIQPRLYTLWTVKNPVLRKIWGLMTVSVSAQIGVAPLVILYFARFSTHFLLTNLWVIPMTSLVMYAAVFMLFLTPFPSLQYLWAGVVETLLTWQNGVLRWIERLPFASIDNIWLDKLDVLLLYLSLALLGYCCWRRTARSLLAMLSVLLLFVSYHTVSVHLSMSRPALAFYNVRGCPSVHCLSGGEHSWLVCADSTANVSRLQNTLRPHWNHLHLSSPEIVTDSCDINILSYQNQLLTYAGKRICFLSDDRWHSYTTSSPLTVDYLYVSRGYRGGIEELTSLFRIGVVIVDTSLSAYYRERIKKECILLHLPCLCLAEKGYHRVLL